MTTLAAEFVRDHREMTRLLLALLESLERQDDAQAMQYADELDRLAGPHIQFEEALLYPTVGRSVGKPFEQQLLLEHQQPLTAIRFLLQHPKSEPLSPVKREALLRQVRVGVDHVERCGRLLSHLTSLDEPTQTRYLQELRHLRSVGRRWSELGNSDDSAATATA